MHQTVPGPNLYPVYVSLPKGADRMGLQDIVLVSTAMRIQGLVRRTPEPHQAPETKKGVAAISGADLLRFGVQQPGALSVFLAAAVG